jgi:hypothetical protein
MIEGIPTWSEELRGMTKLLTDWKILVLTPAFLASNFFYAYQFALRPERCLLLAEIEGIELNDVLVIPDVWVVCYFGCT